LYRKKNKYKGFALLHYYTKIKECWRQTHLELVKTYNDAVDLVASLATSSGFPIGNKKAKLSMTEAASSDMVQSLIMSRRTCSFGSEKSDVWWKALLSKQD
jgi:hypothetical protein